MRKPNGYGGVFKMSGKRRKPFAARVLKGYNPNTGSPEYEYLGFFEKQQEAELFLAEFNKNPNYVKKQKTFKEVYDLLYTQKEKDRDEDTLQGYRYGISKLERLYKKNMNEISLELLQTVFDSMEVKSYNTLRKIRSVCKSVFSYAMQLDLIEKDYAQYINIGTNKGDGQKIPYTSEEIKLIWENKDNYMYLDILLILLYSGMRPGEIIEIKTDEVFLNENYMIGGIKTDAGKNRIIPIHTKVKPIIEEYYNKDNEYLAWDKSLNKRISYNMLKDRFDDTRKELKLDHQLHECRHTFISRANTLGLNQVAIQRIVGHASKTITDRVYTHKDKEELIAIINQFDYELQP